MGLWEKSIPDRGKSQCKSVGVKVRLERMKTLVEGQDMSSER